MSFIKAIIVNNVWTGFMASFKKPCHALFWKYLTKRKLLKTMLATFELFPPLFYQQYDLKANNEITCCA